MLKRKINKATFDALNPAIQFEYKKESDDSYVLDTDDARELMQARDNEKREKEAIAKERDDIKKELKTIKDSNSNWESLETSYKSQIAALQADNEAANTTVTQLKRERATGPAADKIASKFLAPGLIRDKILPRLDIDPRDDSKVLVLDAAGKPTALTLVDLEKEFVDNPEYKSIVIAHKGSGSASGGLPVVPGQTTDPNSPKKTIAQMKPAEIVEHRRAQKAAAAQQAAGGNAA